MEGLSTIEFTLKMVFAVLILFGNSLVIYLYFIDRRIRKKKANKFVISLAFCDMLVAIVFIPCHEFFQNSIQKVLTLPIAGYITSIVTLGSLWNLTALTYDRFVAIFYALRYEDIMTGKKIKRIMMGIWASDLWITFLPLSWKFVTSAKTNAFILHVYQFILVIVMTTVHVILIGVYIALFWINRSHLKFSQRQSSRFARERRQCIVNKEVNELSPGPTTLGRVAFQCDLGQFKGQGYKASSQGKDSIELINEDKINEVHMNEYSVNAITPNNNAINLADPPSSSIDGQLTCSAVAPLERLSNSRVVCVELRAAKVVLILFLFNTICWLPTVTLNVVYLVSWLNGQPHIHLTLKSISSYCFLIYSLVNPWIYGILKADFKIAIKRHLLKRQRPV